MVEDDLGDDPWRLPADGHDHERTWMAYGATRAQWAGDLDRARAAVAAIAAAITPFEPVSMLVRPDEAAEARDRLGESVTLVETELADLWIGRSGPTFVTENRRLGALAHGASSGDDDGTRVPSVVADRAGARPVRTELMIEGGALSVDGGGTALLAESAVLGGERNPGWDKDAVERELDLLLGLRTIIWLPGEAQRDGRGGGRYARFAGKGTVLAARPGTAGAGADEIIRSQVEVLREARDTDGDSLKVISVSAESLDYYVCNGGLILPKGVDAAAREALTELYPDHTVTEVDAEVLASGGGISDAALAQPALS